MNSEINRINVPTPRRRRRKSNEQAIKDSVVIIGSLLMFLAFGLLLEENISNNGWSESRENKITICATFLGILVFSALFGFYIYSRTKKSCRSSSVSQDNSDDSQDIRQQRTEQNDPPPSYVTIMGDPPPYHTSMIVIDSPQPLTPVLKIEVRENRENHI